MHNFFQIYFQKCCKKNLQTQNKRQAPRGACRLYIAGTFHTAHWMAVLFSTCFRA